MIKHTLLFYFVTFYVTSFAQLPDTFVPENQPIAPDYTLEENWSTLPFREDNADIIPKSEEWVSDSLKKVDVFYIHPTMYKSKKASSWTADLKNQKVNDKVDNSPIKYQATAFNQTARIYAPRYRQGHYEAYFRSLEFRNQVMDFAYQDVKSAFEYYLENFNDGRPIIIASHSQGTTHSRRLIKEFFDTEEKKKKLVCAYLVGYAIYKENYEALTPCKSPEETNCYITWASFKNGYEYDGLEGDFLVGNVCVNPISWTIDTNTYKSKTSILLSVSSNKKYRVETKIKDNLLWINSKLPFVGGMNTMHIIDYNLFWYNIRNNVALRTEYYFNK